MELQTFLDANEMKLAVVFQPVIHVDEVNKAVRKVHVHCQIQDKHDECVGYVDPHTRLTEITCCMTYEKTLQELTWQDLRQTMHEMLRRFVSAIAFGTSGGKSLNLVDSKGKDFYISGVFDDSSESQANHVNYKKIIKVLNS